MNKNRAVAYCRASDTDRGRSGLDAQRKSVQTFATRANLNVEWFAEIAGLKNKDSIADRPALSGAVKRARALECPLIVSRLDRLSDSVRLVDELMAQHVTLVITDVAGKADPFVLNAFSTNPPWLGLAHSQRTKEGLEAAKARGVRLGNPKLRPGAGAKAMNQKFNKRALSLLAIFTAARSEGCTSLKEIAEYLNSKGIPGPSGGKWNQMAVKRHRDAQRGGPV